MIQCLYLNALLDSKDITLITHNSIDGKFFSDYPEEFKFIREHIDKYGNVPDKAVFLSQFPQFDILEVNESREYLVKTLYEDLNRRQVTITFNKMRDLLNSNKVEEALRVYTSSIDKLVTSTPLKSVDILRDTSRYESYVEKMRDFTRYFVSTGFAQIDEVLGGWNRQNELAVIMGRPGSGKSFCLLKSALAAAQQGLNVGYYSGEMDLDSVGYRIDTLQSHISNGAIYHGSESIQNEYRRHLETLAQTVPGHLRIITPQLIGGLATVNSLRAFVENENLDILFVDQHSLLDDIRGGKSSVERATNISIDLKNLQVTCNIPIVAASQQNREDKDSTGVATTANIAQSDRIGQDATTVIGVEQKDGVMSLHMVKSRNSMGGKSFKYAIDLNRGIFEYIPEGDKDVKESGADLKKEFDEFDPSTVQGEDIF